MANRQLRRPCSVISFFALLVAGAGAQGQTKETAEEKPSVSLASALAAACRQNDAQFMRYQTMENATAFRDLLPNQKAELMKRIVQTREAGRPLLSTGA
ncbi:MAG TPA: hypothetical protein VGQ11_12630, partial [Candidatus Acidoferrales bacterium]|nr:hypothetical protein [Candidatus Acidoferrales bacterium]